MIKIKRLKLLLFTSVLFTLSSLSFLTVHASGWGFKKNPHHETPFIGGYQKVIENTDSYYVGDTNKKEIYLTFEVGYDNGVLSQILDILNDKKIKASFFITGDFVKRFPELAIRLSNEGHVVCNHTYTHRKITSLNINELESDLNKLNDEYYNLTNKHLTKCVRPPEGVFDRQSLLNLQKLGYKTVFWSIAYCDWYENNQPSIKTCKEAIISNLHNGAIILLHSVSKTNKDALSIIIDEIISLGYSFKCVDELGN